MFVRDLYRYQRFPGQKEKGRYQRPLAQIGLTSQKLNTANRMLPASDLQPQHSAKPNSAKPSKPNIANRTYQDGLFKKANS